MKMLAALLMMVSPMFARGTRAAAPDPWKPLSFLTGTWNASAKGDGGVKALGAYTFRMGLGGHVMGRHGERLGACSGPADFDCDHGDLLYVLQESPGQPLKAIYFDNEGHVIHYDVSVPSPASVMFLSDASQPGPQFRLMYELVGGVLAGKFQMQMPGQSQWRFYLEWSGGKK